MYKKDIVRDCFLQIRLDKETKEHLISISQGIPISTYVYQLVIKELKNKKEVKYK